MKSCVNSIHWRIMDLINKLIHHGWALEQYLHNGGTVHATIKLSLTWSNPLRSD